MSDRKAPPAVSATDVPARTKLSGDRPADDSVRYPDADLQAVPRGDGTWRFTRRDGTPY